VLGSQIHKEAEVLRKNDLTVDLTPSAGHSLSGKGGGGKVGGGGGVGCLSPGKNVGGVEGLREPDSFPQKRRAREKDPLAFRFNLTATNEGIVTKRINIPCGKKERNAD